MTKIPRLALSPLLLCALYVPVTATTWNINPSKSGDAPTIQAGIDSAAAGDTVRVSAGTYLENIDFKGKAIVVKGEGRLSTTIDGSAMSTSCVLFTSGESREAVIEGFTLTGGRGYVPKGVGTPFGGGIYVRNSEPMIRDLRIVGNSAAMPISWSEIGFGGGVSCSANLPVSPTIENCEIVDNEAGGSGGGIAILGTLSPNIKDNVIKDNRTNRGDAGGIWLRSSVDGSVVSGNIIERNVAWDHGGGILAVQDGIGPPLQFTLSWNVVSYNVARFMTQAEVSGGGVLLVNTNAWVHHNTIVGNQGGSASSDTASGGGIAVIHGDPLIEQNIIAFSLYGGGVTCIEDAAPVFRDNLAWSNRAWLNHIREGSGTCETWWEGNRNVVTDPYFCAYLSGDYSLAENSPALLHPSGPLGALPMPGCGPVSVERTTWGRIKATFGR